jgi:hypothetical protein
MEKSPPFYLVDKDSHLIHVWPGKVFFMGTTDAPIIYEKDSPIEEVYPLPKDFDVEEIQACCAKHKLEHLLELGNTPVLMVCNASEMGRIETGLMVYKLNFVPICDNTFRFSDERIDIPDGDGSFREILGYPLMERPLSKPNYHWKHIPFIDHKGDLVISQQCDSVWQWWKGGLDPITIIKCFQDVFPKNLYLDLAKRYSHPKKDNRTQ